MSCGHVGHQAQADRVSSLSGEETAAELVREKDSAMSGTGTWYMLTVCWSTNFLPGSYFPNDAYVPLSVVCTFPDRCPTDFDLPGVG